MNLLFNITLSPQKDNGSCNRSPPRGEFECCVKWHSLLYDRVVILLLDLTNEDKTINRRVLGRKVFGNKVIRLGHIA